MMPENWESEPLVGVNGIRLGMTYTEVVERLGTPSNVRSSPPASVADWSSGLAVRFNPDAEFIEFARGMGLSPRLHGVEIFAESADDVIRRMVESGSAFDSDTERGHSFVFLSLQVGFWRSTVPGSDSNPDGRYFDSVGLGKPNDYR
jgi:hypothetical protein